MGNPKPSLVINPPTPKVRRRRGLTLVRGVLGTALKRYGLDKEVARYQFVLHWEEIVGQQLSRVTSPRSLRGATLEVGVANSVLAQELSFQKATLLARLRRFLDEDQIVSDIRFYVSAE